MMFSLKASHDFTFVEAFTWHAWCDPFLFWPLWPNPQLQAFSQSLRSLCEMMCWYVLTAFCCELAVSHFSILRGTGAWLLSRTFGAEPKHQAESVTGFCAKNFQLILSLLFSPLKVEQQFSGNECVFAVDKNKWLTYPWRDACQHGRGEQWI